MEAACSHSEIHVVHTCAPDLQPKVGLFQRAQLVNVHAARLAGGIVAARRRCPSWRHLCLPDAAATCASPHASSRRSALHLRCLARRAAALGALQQAALGGGAAARGQRGCASALLPDGLVVLPGQQGHRKALQALRPLLMVHLQQALDLWGGRGQVRQGWAWAVPLGRWQGGYGPSVRRPGWFSSRQAQQAKAQAKAQGSGSLHPGASQRPPQLPPPTVSRVAAGYCSTRSSSLASSPSSLSTTGSGRAGYCGRGCTGGGKGRWAVKLAGQGRAVWGGGRAPSAPGGTHGQPGGSAAAATCAAMRLRIHW